MAHLLRKKQRLISKKKELNETWDEARLQLQVYVEKLNYVVDAVLSENNSVVFFQTYPKVSCNVDKILNIFLQVQCKLNLFSCEDIFNGDYKCEVSHVDEDNGPSEPKEDNRRVFDFEEESVTKIGAREEVSGTPEVEQCAKQVLNSEDVEDLSIEKVGALEEDVCDLSAEVCPATEWVVVENSTPSVGNVSETKKQIAGIVEQFSRAEGRFGCEINKDSKTECDVTSAKRRISHGVLQSGEVLEMVYAHGDSPWNFWLCYYPCSDREFLQKGIRSLYYSNKLEFLSTVPEVGDHVLVADGKRFLRGQVLTVRGTDLLDTTCVMILDLDSGRMKSFKLRYVWKIPEELMCVQAQAVNCQLQSIVGDCSIWCKENLRKCRMDRRFEEMMLQTTLSVKFIGTQGDSSLPRYIIDADGINLETDKICNVSQLVNDTMIPIIMQRPDVETSSQKGEAFVLQDSSVNEINGNITSVSYEHGTESLVNVANTQQVPENCSNGQKITEKQINGGNETNRNIISVFCEHSPDSMINVTNAQQVHENGTGCLKIPVQQTNGVNDFSRNVSEHGADSMVNVGNAQLAHEKNMDGIYQELNSHSSHCTASIQESLLHEIVTDLNSQKVNDFDCAEMFSLCGTSYSDAEDNVNTDEKIKRRSYVTGTEVQSTENGESSSSVMASIYCGKDIILEKRNYSNVLNKTVLGVPTIVDSPSLFCMQFILDANDEFEYLHKKMGIFYSENKMKFSSKETARYIIKSFCAAMYPQDGKWYRAEVIDWMPSKGTSVCVCFVDVGDKMVIELDLIQPLAKEFAEVPVLSQRCHLYAVAPVETAMYSYVSYEWLVPAVSLFRNILTSGHIYTMQIKEFTSYGSVGVVLVDPTSPDTSINEKLIALGEAKYLLNEENLSLWDPMKEEYERCAHYSYNDEDACEAVTGYSPNDEQRFCKFYARHGRCFKGSNCRKEHVLSHPGGWISDKEEVFQNAFSQIKLPEVGETVFIQVTCVIRINLFYIVLVEDSPEEETLLTLNRYINDKDNLKNLRKLDITPAIGQLVLAHYHQDGIWYRARVIDTDNDSNLVQVFFVDYGNTEWVNEMYVRDIDPQYLHLPFQAIESSLAFADMNASVDDDSLETVISVFRCLTDCTQPLKAKIISKDDVLKKLELQLYDVNNQDIALMLSDTGYVSITSVQMTPATAFGIPG